MKKVKFNLPADLKTKLNRVAKKSGNLEES